MGGAGFPNLGAGGVCIPPVSPSRHSHPSEQLGGEHWQLHPRRARRVRLGSVANKDMQAFLLDAPKIFKKKSRALSLGLHVVHVHDYLPQTENVSSPSMVFFLTRCLDIMIIHGGLSPQRQGVFFLGSFTKKTGRKFRTPSKAFIFSSGYAFFSPATSPLFTCLVPLL